MQLKSISKTRANQTAHYFKSPQAQRECRRITARAKGRDLTESEWYCVLSLLSPEGKAKLKASVETLLEGAPL